MQGDSTLDLTDVTYKELHCESLQGRSVVIAGNARAFTPAILSDEATLHVRDRQLIFNPVTSGNSKILGLTRELNRMRKDKFETKKRDRSPSF